jgi:MFS transporter, DHA1 family, inner membrane transport protein
MNKNERLILLLLAALNFTHILDFMIMMPLGNYLMPHFHISPREFSYLVSAYAISAGISSFLSAFYVNDFDRKKVLIWAYAGFLIGSLGCGLANSYALLLSARIVAGLFGGLIGAQVISIVADLIPFERRGAAMGVVMASFAMASTFGVPFSLKLANMLSWHAPFIFVAGLGLCIIPLLYAYIPAMSGHTINGRTDSRFEVLSQIIKNKNQWLALIFTLLMFMGHFTIIPFINPYLEFNKGISKEVTPYVYLFGGIAAFFAANFFGKLSDKMGKWKTYVMNVVLAFPFILLITHMPDMAIPFVLAVFVCWFSVATGRGVAAQALSSNVAPVEYRGSFQSFNSFMQQMGSGIASLLAGFLVSKSPQGPLVGYGTLGIVSIVILLLSIYVGHKAFNTKL